VHKIAFNMIYASSHIIIIIGTYHIQTIDFSWHRSMLIILTLLGRCINNISRERFILHYTYDDITLYYTTYYDYNMKHFVWNTILTLYFDLPQTHTHTYCKVSLNHNINNIFNKCN